METMESIETMQNMHKFAKYKINLLKNNAIKRAKEKAKKEKEQAKQQYIDKCNDIKKELENKITKIKTM
jgi:ATP/GTP-binding site motif protein A protein